MRRKAFSLERKEVDACLKLMLPDLRINIDAMPYQNK
jgi:hypothetical protein